MDNFDTTTNTIYTDGTSGSIARGSGQLFIKQLKNDAKKFASDGLKQDWATIKKWLGLKNNKISDDANEKIALAWQSYMALGISPSLPLDKTFAFFKVKAIKENWEIINVPKEVKGVFDRLLATESEIAKKQLFLRYKKYKETGNIMKKVRDEADRLYAIDCEIAKKKSKKNKFAPISFVKRKADSISNELALSKSEAKAWKIIILLGCFAGFMLKYFTTADYDLTGEWLDPYEAFMWTLTGGIISFLVLYATRLLNSKHDK